MQTKLTDVEAKETLASCQRNGSQIPGNTPKADSLATSVGTTPQKDKIRWFASHRNYFGFSFVGPQPTRGADSLARVGRKHTTPQARFEFPEYRVVVQTMPHSLKVWAKHPRGVKTPEQEAEGLGRALEVARIMARKHGLAELRLVKIGFSEHTVEQGHLDRLLRNLIAQEPELCEKLLGMTVNQTSHKGKVEITDRDKPHERPPAKERVKALEYWLDRGMTENVNSLGRLEEAAVKQFELLSRLVKLFEPKAPEEPKLGAPDGGMYR